MSEQNAKNKEKKRPVIHNEHLERLYNENNLVRKAAQNAVENYTAAQLDFRPGRNKWSILEVFDHMNTLMSQYFPAIETHIRELKDAGVKSDEPFKPTWFGNLFIWFILPENKLKVKTIRRFQPRSQNLSKEAVLNRFNELTAQLERFIIESDGLPLNGKKIQSPASRLVRFTLGEVLWLLTAHNHRHVLQIRRIQESPNFPK